MKQLEPDIDYKIASHRREFWEAFRLVHDAYVRRGLTAPNDLGMRITPFHALPTTEVVIGSEGEDIICTATIVHDGNLGLPLECIYGPEVRLRRSRGLLLAEVSCLADRTECSDRSFPVLARLMSLIAQSSRRRGADQLLIAVHPRHAGFYERFLGFVQIGDERTYPSVRNHPAVALSLDLVNLAKQHEKAHRRLFGHPFPLFTLERPRISSAVWNSIHELIHNQNRLAEAQIA